MRDHDDFGSQLLAQASTVRSIGARRLRDRAELDDFTQDVFLRAFANREQLRDAERLPQWVAAIARNAATAANARERAVPDVVLEMLPDWRPTPDAHAESVARWRRLIQALESLDEEDREILRSRYLEELDYEALQERHGLSYTAVSTRLHRARAALRRRVVGVLGVVFAGLVEAPRRAFSAVSQTAEKGPFMKALLVAAALHVAVGIGWVGKHAASQFDRIEDVEVAVESVDNRPRGASGVPRAAGTAGAVGIGRGGYLRIDAPELFDPIDAEGITVELRAFLEDVPKPGQHWVVLGKPGMYALALREASDPWYGMSRLSERGLGDNLLTSLDSVTFTDDGVSRSHGGGAVPDAMVLGHWIPIVARLRAQGGSITQQASMLFDYPGSHGGVMSSSGRLRVHRTRSPIFIGGMPESDMIYGPPLGGGKASVEGWIGQVRISRGLRPELEGREGLPTQLEADSETLALWDFSREVRPGMFEDLSGHGHVIQYVGARRAERTDLPRIGEGDIPAVPAAFIQGRATRSDIGEEAEYHAALAAYGAHSWNDTARLLLDGSRSYVLSEGPDELETLTEEGVTVEWWFGLTHLPKADEVWTLMSQDHRYSVELGIALASDSPGYPLAGADDAVRLTWNTPAVAGARVPIMREQYDISETETHLLGEGTHVSLYMQRSDTDSGVMTAHSTFMPGSAGGGSGGGAATLLRGQGRPLLIAPPAADGRVYRGWIEGLRISRGPVYRRPMRPGQRRRKGRRLQVPERPPQSDERTLALWDFSEGPDADEYHDVTGHGYVIRAVPND